jgi:hypothetical protein
MKSILLVLLLLVPFTARAELCRDWSIQDTMLQGVGTALILWDWKQTREFASIPDQRVVSCTVDSCTTQEKSHRESNFFMSSKPSPEEINLKIGTGLTLFTIVSCILPPSLRTAWQGIVIGAEGHAVYLNVRHGF